MKNIIFVALFIGFIVLMFLGASEHATILNAKGVLGGCGTVVSALFMCRYNC